VENLGPNSLTICNLKKKEKEEKKNAVSLWSSIQPNTILLSFETHSIDKIFT
jgi:hypothetical protein